jgi:hypothetical protein
MTLTNTGSSQTGDMVVEIVKPDRVHFKLTSRGQNIEIIQIGTDLYQNAGGQWVKMPPQAALPLSFDANDIVQSFNEQTSQGQTVTKGGLGLVDGAPCQEWISQGPDPSKGGTMCLGLLDDLPRQFKSTDGSTTMTFTDWNSAISIDPPI